MNALPELSPKDRVIKTFEQLGYRLVREETHIAMTRYTSDGLVIPLTIPNHPYLKASTIKIILTRAGIARNSYLEAYDKS
jgi:predicted RNA binding protein YcfA (HicA-like mRNA interferase family)